MIANLTDWCRPEMTGKTQIRESVSKIIEEVTIQGDDAIERYSLKFDQFRPKIITLKSFSEYELEESLANSINLAASRIEKFALFQLEQGAKSATFSDEFGEYGQRVLPLERVGAYIPGGRFPLISTALMTLIPAKIAGCTVRIACSPSDHPAILAAASLAGATKFVQIGGVQAMTALALGYQGEAPVDAIVGPGNAWVNEAKKQLQSLVKIDGLAGPSELLAICDENQPVDWLALDALAQAEHDPMACSIIISDSQDWLNQMTHYLNQNEDTQQLVKNKQVELLFANTADELLSFANQYAPEHLMLCHQSISSESLNNYGSLFIGANSAVALGDYISGPNHTLPTLGYAKQQGGLSVATFQKIISTQEISENGAQHLSQAAIPIAQSEGLKYHSQSLKVRSN